VNYAGSLRDEGQGVSRVRFRVFSGPFSDLRGSKTFEVDEGRVSTDWHLDGNFTTADVSLCKDVGDGSSCTSQAFNR
jgi:hypothetical protein